METKNYKNNLIAFLLVVILILTAVILVPRFGSPPPPTTAPNSSSAVLMAGMPMATKTFAVLPGQILPTISFAMQQDSTGGWDVHIATTNFTFTPQKIDGEPVLGEGHVHLYIDGNLVVVLSPWYHIDPLPSGRHSIRAALANNDHSLYTYNGKTIDQTQEITVK